VIMAGGHGTRFWPRSRRRVPKQLLSIGGRHTLLQETVRRLLPLFSWRYILVVTNAEQAEEVRRQLPRLAPDHLLVEPVGRNTLPCLALAAEWIGARHDDALMMAAPADHVIKDAGGLRRTVRAACDLASRRDCLVALGVQPTRPETGFGYVEVGPAIEAPARRAHWVERFHEKPSAPTARRYVSSGRYLWNSGMFVWKTSVFRRAADECAPSVRAALRGLWNPRRGSRRSGNRGVEQRLRRAYRGLPAVSVDVGILQPISAMRSPAPRVAVVRADFDWNDVGSWVALHELWGCDADGNAALGKIVPIDSSDVIVYSPERLVALIGIKDLIVVDSSDALLICARDRAQDVRKVTEALKERRWYRYL